MFQIGFGFKLTGMVVYTDERRRLKLIKQCVIGQSVIKQRVSDVKTVFITVSQEMEICNILLRFYEYYQ